MIAIVIIPALLATAGLGYWLRLQYLRSCMTRQQRERRELLRVIMPYVSKRRRDRPGQTLKRAALGAYCAGKITKKQQDLFK